ncbi:MAG: pyruvate ferredoxin oxidoreductase [Candidatus Heimdallarchaeota archaeon]
MATHRLLTGNEAAVYGAMLCRPQIVAIYPITPQSEISEMFADFNAKNKLGNTKVFRVESEHSAMSILIGAAMVGARTYTATASNGLFYMHEAMSYVPGARLPIVMAVTNRTLSPPWNVWCDHQDSIMMRDTGWLQLYIENAQEVLDTTIQAYRITENSNVLLPLMICLDGFTVTHLSEGVVVPDQDEVENFLPDFDSQYGLDKFMQRDEPVCLAHLSRAEDSFMEYKYLQATASENSKQIIENVDKEFGTHFGRAYGGLVVPYKVEDAEIVLLTLGSISTTAKAIVDEYRRQGVKVGVLKLRAYRPFPSEALQTHLNQVDVVGVIDRDFSCGYSGGVYADTAAALQKFKNGPKIINFVVGLGGRDVTFDHFRLMLKRLLGVAKTGKIEQKTEWIGVR